MRILIGKTFGIGNAICAIPMIKAISSLGHQVDVLVGSYKDDFGASWVFKQLLGKCIKNLYIDGVPGFVVDRDMTYDLAIMAMPFDGRWREGVHFKAKDIWDGRTRPDGTTFGFLSWERHEIEYQMEWAHKLGYTGGIPDCSFRVSKVGRPSHFYLGIGYKKDDAGFWSQKHWGDQNFIELVDLLLANPMNHVFCTGALSDAPCMTRISDAHRHKHPGRFHWNVTDLDVATAILEMCGSYLGNDTGMMHVAAAMKKDVVAFFNMENAITKSRPWCQRNRVFDGTRGEVTPRMMYGALGELK